MKLLFTLCAAALVLSGCASGPESAQAVKSHSASCRDVDPPTGSRLVRRSDCESSARVQTGNADDLRNMQELQRNTSNLSGNGR